MPSYIVTARDKSSDKKKFLSDDITSQAELSYLEIDDGETEYTPGNAIAKNDWIGKVIKDSVKSKNKSMADYYKSLSGLPAQEDKNERADLLFFLHGYNNDIKTIHWRHTKLKESLEQVGYWGNVVSFDWPCNDEAVLYLSDRSKAHDTSRFLVVDIFSEIAKRFSDNCKINIHVLAHSMGSYVLQEAFRYARNARPDLINNGWRLQQVVLIGADLACSDFKENGDSLYFAQSANRVTNYVNAHDSALKASNLKHSITPLPGELDWSDRVGRKGFPDDISTSLSNCYNVSCNKFYSDHVSGDSRDEEVYWNSIGFPPKSKIVSRPNLSHSWHIGNENFTKDLVETLHGDLDRAAMPTRFVDGSGKIHLKGDE